MNLMSWVAKNYGSTRRPFARQRFTPSLPGFLSPRLTSVAVVRVFLARAVVLAATVLRAALRLEARV